MSGIPEPLRAEVAELRGPAAPDTDRGGETQAGEEDEWVRIHLSECAACERMHAEMLEASVSYRGGSRQA